MCQVVQNVSVPTTLHFCRGALKCVTHVSTEVLKQLSHTLMTILEVDGHFLSSISAIEDDLKDPSGCVCPDGTMCVIDGDNPNGYCPPNTEGHVGEKKSDSE